MELVACCSLRATSFCALILLFFHKLVQIDALLEEIIVVRKTDGLKARMPAFLPEIFSITARLLNNYKSNPAYTRLAKADTDPKKLLAGLKHMTVGKLASPYTG